MTQTDAAPQLEIVFRYLMLYYSSPEGLKVLVPAAGHRALLRDIATDSIHRLSQASIRLQSRADRPAARTEVVTHDLLVPLERPLKERSVQPLPQYLQRAPVDPALCALIELSGGRLEAFPCEAFPERAHQLVEFKFGPINTFASRVTDTTLFRVPVTGPTELVVSTPRRTVSIDVTYGGRFELRNEDDKIGPVVDETKYHTEEANVILSLVLGEGVQIQCDTYSCAGFVCGVHP